MIFDGFRFYFTYFSSLKDLNNIFVVVFVVRCGQHCSFVVFGGI